MRRVRGVLGAIVAASVVTGASAAADTPQEALRAAIDRTAAAKTAHLSITQTVSGSGRSTRSTSLATLAHGDQDVATSGDAGEARRVGVGATSYERRPNTPNAPWRTAPRTPPAQDAAFGPLTLRDGTSLGDPHLYRSVTDAGVDVLAQGPARKLVAELDMAAVAGAMGLSAPDQARLVAMRGVSTIWIAQRDGRIARHLLTLTIPSANGSTTVETELDLSDLDAPLVVTPP